MTHVAFGWKRFTAHDMGLFLLEDMYSSGQDSISVGKGSQFMRWVIFCWKRIHSSWHGSLSVERGSQLVHDTDRVLLEEIHSSWHAGSHSAEIGQARRELQPTSLEGKMEKLNTAPRSMPRCCSTFSRSDWGNLTAERSMISAFPVPYSVDQIRTSGSPKINPV